MSSNAIYRASRIGGDVVVPGDKSISHRLAMLASLAEGVSVIENYSSSADCHSTLNCLSLLGIPWAEEAGGLRITGRGLGGYQSPRGPLDVGNSGSTIRMITGILAAQPFGSTLDGDASIRRRPMKRIVEPLRQMGARIEAVDGDFPPLCIEPSKLNPISFHLKVPSAQVKSCVLFAGLFAEGRTSVFETSPSRNHTELLLPAFGVKVLEEAGGISVEGLPRLEPVSYRVPGDASSAAFLVGAALLAPEADLTIRDVLMNPTRTGLVDYLREQGAPIEKLGRVSRHGEPVGSLRIHHQGWTKGLPARVWDISGDRVPSLIDELPVLALLGTVSPAGIRIRDARELRVKESDRISAMTQNLRALGARVEEFEDGLMVHPIGELKGGHVSAFGDHRIAMTMALAGLRASDTVRLDDRGVVAVSFPQFFDLLKEISG